MSARTSGAGRTRPDRTLGELVTGQLRRLCQVSGLGPSDAETYALVLADSLGAAAERSLDLPAPSRSFLSDDSTPVEFSLSFAADASPRLRVLLEPGCGAGDLREDGRTGLRVVRSMAGSWGFDTGQLDALEDLFLPPDPQGPLALWIALELRPGGVPRMKVYLNPAASGPARAAATIREALDRLGHRHAFDALPPADGHPFFALDLGDWAAPRVKIYATHHGLPVTGVGGLCRMESGPDGATLEEFLRTAGGFGDGAGQAPAPGALFDGAGQASAPEARFDRRPVLTCHSFTRTTGGPTGFTLHVPVRDYVRDDAEALRRAGAVLGRHGLGTETLARSLSALTPRAPQDGAGLIAYLALAHEQHQPPRVTTYISSEAYEVRPPNIPSAHRTAPAAAGHAPLRRHSNDQPFRSTSGARTSMEPYRIKVVEPIALTTRQQREAALERVHYNLFDLRAEEVTIDLLSDSGTGAISAAQLAAGMEGDESYAGSRSFYRFHETVTELTGYRHILPAHQGRAAERILFNTLLEPGGIVLANTHFDTTRANVELSGCQAHDIPCAEARDLDSERPFKGNIDLDKLRTTLEGPDGARVRVVIMTITNNGGGGQPVSMENLKQTAEICRRHGVPMILDAARFAENAWLVTRHEEGYRDRTPRQVAEEAFRLADGCVMSAKKDGIVHIGGFIGLNDPELAEKCERLLIATEGFATYGGLAGRDLDMMATGLLEVTEPAYLAERADVASHLADRVRSAGVDILEPPGLHALYLNAGRLLPHIPPHHYPGHALACRLYLEGGIRSAELGSLYLGEEDEDGNPTKSAPYELVRLALPRRVYTRSHYDHVGRTLEQIVKNAESVHGYRIVEQSPILRHFRAKLQPVSS
ncbi:tryptophanase [Streptomyces scabiei]|uniref:Tryptophanase 1 n=1 Tax=Streptomyces scabiei TaxID=1930 RepID=A0A117EDE6_STRSC|nr:tryptophanase [Streptomyces scabiei]GAQ62390.1 tryptophanase 1 [Streptomyces scabiei]